MPHYEARFNTQRLHGLPNIWVECQGIRLESNIGFAFTREICIVLTQTGHADGAITFYEDGSIEPVLTLSSVHEVCQRGSSMNEIQRGPISDILFDALTLIETDPSSWPSLHGRTRNLLLDRDLVNVEGDVPRITDAGQRAMSTHIPRVKIPIPQPAMSSIAIDARKIPIETREVPIAPPQFRYPNDFTNISDEDLLRAAEAIGLKAKNGSLARTLKFIESTITKRTLAEIEQMALRVEVRVRLGRAKSDDMKKRRMLAAIYNAGKLAQAL